MSQKSRKVYIITTVHAALDDRIFHKQATTLSRAGYDVTLIAQYEKDETVHGVRIIALPKPKNRLRRIFGLTWKAFSLSIIGRADIYHFHDPEFLPFGVLLKCFSRSQVIYDVHEDVPKQILNKDWIRPKLRKIIAFIVNMLEISISKNIDAVIAATESIAKKFKSVKNVVVVHNYPKLEQINNLSATPGKTKKIRLIYAGGISKERGIIEMIQALENVDDFYDVYFHLIGEIESPDLERALRAMKGYKKVRYFGWLQQSEVYKCLAEADIGLVCLNPEPRYTVSLPTKLFEYMALGLPVIASNFPLWKGIIEGNKCGICVDPLNPKEIAAAIEYLICNPCQAIKMGERGRHAVKEKYNWEKESEKLLGLYRELDEQ